MSAFLKTIVGLQSSLYLAAAAALLTLGSLLGSQEFSPWTDSLLGRLAIVALVLGGIFFLVGTLGLVSTCCTSSSFSYSFSLLLLLLVIGQILACLLLLLLSSQLHMLIARILQLSMPIYSSTSSSPLPSAVTTTWDLVQASIPCCGVNNPTTDWRTFGNLTSPPSSCPSQPEPTTLSPLLLPSSALLTTTVRPHVPLIRGCLPALNLLMAKHPVPVLATLGGLLGFQVLVLCLSCCLSRLRQSSECRQQQNQSNL